MHSGWNVTINATVENEGIFVEKFNVTAYYNNTDIDTQTVTLFPGANKTLTFIWSTTSVNWGNYTITATATPVPNETDTDDNSYTDGTIRVKITGDVNFDKKVSVADMVEVDIALGSQPGDPNWNPQADVNHNGNISVADMAEVAAHLGESES